MASLRILCVNGATVTSSFKGTIKKEHVRAFEVDKVVMYKSFRIGDIVRARVISRGDRRSYYLSTDRNELGVILATSTAGNPLIPVSWELMQCPETEEVEFRKEGRSSILSSMCTIIDVFGPSLNPRHSSRSY